MKLSMTRQVTFSAGHRYWLSHLSSAENRELFGDIASPYSHGHNYILEVTVSGKIAPDTGMILNIKRIDDLLKGHILSHFDQKSINDQVPEFFYQSPCLENLLLDIRRRLSVLPPDVALDHIRLYELPTLWSDLNPKDDMITLTRSYEFAASHRLHAPSLDQETNLDLYGKCNNPNGHGHNYVLEVTVSGDQNPQTGFIVNLGELDRVVSELVVDRYDHKNLNEDIPEFEGKITTSEVVVQMIWERLNERVPGRLEKVRLLETARNAFEVTR